MRGALWLIYLSGLALHWWLVIEPLARRMGAAGMRPWMRDTILTIGIISWPIPAVRAIVRLIRARL